MTPVRYDGRIVYAEHAPSRALRPFVRCFWTSFALAPPPSRVLPDGCLDIIFDLQDPRATRFVGAMTRPLSLAGGCPVHVLGVRFAPGGAVPFLRLPADRITDDTLDVTEAWPGGHELAERLAEAEHPISALDAALVDHLADARHAIDPAVAACVRHIEDRRGDVAVTDLEALSGRSARQLERRFAADIGFGPKRFARVVRFRAVLELAPHVTRGSWAEVAADLGFSDQSHLLREVRALGGAPLRELRPSVRPSALEPESGLAGRRASRNEPER